MAHEDIQGGVRLSPLKERRLRYRQETVDAILAAARSVMQEQGVAALNLNEVARRLGISGQALAKYFPNKMALYETLFRMGVCMFRDQDAEIWHTTEPSWERIQAWFEARLTLAQQHPDLYRLALDLPTVPGFVPSEEARQETQQLVAAGTQAIREVIEAGEMVPPIPPDQVFDLLLAIRRGIIAEHLGKQPVLQPREEERFRRLIPQALALLKAAWSPQPRGLMSFQPPTSVQQRSDKRSMTTDA